MTTRRTTGGGRSCGLFRMAGLRLFRIAGVRFFRMAGVRLFRIRPLAVIGLVRCTNGAAMTKWSRMSGLQGARAAPRDEDDILANKVSRSELVRNDDDDEDYILAKKVSRSEPVETEEGDEEDSPMDE